MELAGVFLDRDGTLNVERADYVTRSEEFVWLPGVLPALALIGRLGVPIIVVTNQSAIGRGRVERTTVDGIHGEMRDAAEKQGARIDAVYLCPHTPADACECRKPRAGMLRTAARDFGLVLERCVFVGDAMSDAAAAQTAGCLPILVKTGRQGPFLEELTAGTGIPVVENLQLAAEMVSKWAGESAERGVHAI